MTTEKEQEAFGLVIEHHKNSTSENDIRYAFQRFMEMAAIAEVKESAYLREIARMVEQFDWKQNPTEVAPTLYQNVIAQDERKRLGEYYTPRWLAREITETVVDDPLAQQVLDPSCGSGTFIETAVERILTHAGKLTATERLQKLQENVVGIDIHPVAVQLAKAT